MSAECGGDGLHCCDELFGVLLVYFDIEGIHTGVDLEQEALTFHHGLTAHGTNVTQSEHSSAVGDDCHEVAFVCVTVGIVRVLLDFEARFGHTGGIGQ